MIHLTRALVRRRLGLLLHIDDTPTRTAAAFAFGVFLGFSPLLGLHTLLAIILAFLLDFNRVAVLLGVYSNLPWILAPYYASVTIVGARLTHTRIPDGFKAQVVQLFELSLFHDEFWRQLVVLLRPLLWPYIVGSTLGAIAVAAAAYPLALAFVTSRRRIHDIIHHQKHP
jgi:uncharacterized protein